jgi:hypothetical protein
VLTAAFIVNAAASCAPSRLGGLSAAGEGQAGLGRGGSMKGQQLAIMLMTATTALAVALVYLGHLKG